MEGKRDGRKEDGRGKAWESGGMRENRKRREKEERVRGNREKREESRKRKQDMRE